MKTLKDPSLDSGSTPIVRVVSSPQERAATDRPPQAHRSEPPLHAHGSEGVLTQPGLHGHGSGLAGLAIPVAGSVRLPPTAGGKLHRSGVPRRDLLQGHQLAGVGHHRRLLPQPDRFLCRPCSPQTSLVSGAQPHGPLPPPGAGIGRGPRRDRLGGQPEKRHRAGAGQVSLPIRPKLPATGRNCLPTRGCPGLARHSHRRRAATRTTASPR